MSTWNEDDIRPDDYGYDWYTCPECGWHGLTDTSTCDWCERQKSGGRVEAWEPVSGEQDSVEKLRGELLWSEGVRMQLNDALVKTQKLYEEKVVKWDGERSALARRIESAESLADELAEAMRAVRKDRCCCVRITYIVKEALAQYDAQKGERP